MRPALLAIALFVIAACAPLAGAAPAPTPSVTAHSLGTASPSAQIAASSPTTRPLPTVTPPTPSPSPEAKLWPMRTTAGIEFALVESAADLRIERTISADDASAIAAAVNADVSAVESEFERRFSSPPPIYVFATNDSYAQGLTGILGYGPVTAAFVAENSVSFFEPALLVILVNWQAIGDRRPIAAIRHELTHRLTLDACAPRCDLVPAWFNEGQARLSEARVPGSAWRVMRMRYEAASMAATDTLIPLNTLVSQLSWNALTDWAGYYKYQQAARATELLREDVGGDAPIARIYERLRRGENLARAYENLTGRTFNDFVATLRSRMLDGIPAGPGLVTLPMAPDGPGASYLLYGFAPSATVTFTLRGTRSEETWPMTVSPFGAAFDTLPPARGGWYTLSVRQEGTFISTKVRSPSRAVRSDTP